jgi:ankyrin repeat protein
MPSDLNMSYARTLERVSNQQDQPRKLAYRMLLWLSQARRPLSLQELSQAVAVDVGEVYLNKKKMSKEGIMTRVCMGLVVVDRDTSVIRLVHFSMQEYLHTHLERSESGLIFVEKDMIVKTCLTILLFDEFGKGECKSDAEFELRVQEYPIFFYAAANWTYHAGSEGNDESGRLTLRFLRDKHKVSSAIQAIMVNRQSRFEGYSQRFPDKFTGLHMAAYYGLKESVSLLASNWKIDEQDGYWRTPLSYAVENGHEAVVERLLAKDDVDLDSKDMYGHTPLWLAVENGHEAVVQQLLAKDGIDPNSGDCFGLTPLALAVQNGHEAVVKLLLAREGVDPDSKDREGLTPLSWAARNGHETMVKLLLEREGVDPDSKDRYGRTPLSWAAENGYKAVVKLLLAREGVDPDSKDRYGLTPLSWPARNGHEPVVKLLLAREGVDPNSKDRYGLTPLSWAAENGHETVVKLLLAREGVDPDSKDRPVRHRNGGAQRRGTRRW